MHPKPYVMELRKFMEEESASYLVGQVISPTLNPLYIICEINSLSKINPLEFDSNGIEERTSFVYAL